MYARLIDFYQDGLVSARRVYEVIDVGRDVPEVENPITLPRLKGDIEFRNVSFSYGTAETLKDVNLKPDSKSGYLDVADPEGNLIHLLWLPKK